MKCKVENCVFEASDLVKHIICKHKMTIKEYKEKYSTEVIDDKLINERQQTRKDKYIICCSLCNEKFPSQSALDFHFVSSKDIKHNHHYFNDSNKDDWVECTECTLRKPTICKHILEHNLNVSVYKGEIYSINYKKQLEQDRKEKREKNCKFRCPVENCDQLPFKTQKALDRHLITSKDIDHNHCYFNDSNKDDWVECAICEERRNVLTIHLKEDHNISSKEYKEIYKREIFSKNYLENQYKSFVNAGAHAPKEREKVFKCPVADCIEKFSTEHLLSHHMRDSQDYAHSSLIFNESNINDWVECKVLGCGYRSKRIDFHIKQKHSLTLEQYKKEYGKYLSKNFLQQSMISGMKDHESEKFLGQNNSFYGKSHSRETRQQISKTLSSKVDQEKKKNVLLQQVERLDQDDNENIDTIIDNICEG